jgi:hypothetical protein
MNQSYSADHQVRRRNGDTLTKQGTPHLPKFFSTTLIEIQHMYVLQQISDLLEQWRWIVDVVRPRVKRCQYNRRNEQTAGVLQESVRKPARPSKVSGTNVGIQEMTHSLSI